jgi:hypothetical protein
MITDFPEAGGVTVLGDRGAGPGSFLEIEQVEEAILF